MSIGTHRSDRDILHGHLSFTPAFDEMRSPGDTVVRLIVIKFHSNPLAVRCLPQVFAFDDPSHDSYWSVTQLL